MNTTLLSSAPVHLNPWFQCFSSLVVVIIQIVGFLVGLPLNIYIILLIRAGGLDGSVIFNLSHALNDIFFILPAPLYLLCYIQKLCFMPLLLYFCATCLASRMLIQCCVSIECYLAVVHPVVFLKYKHWKYRLACSVVIWTFALTISVVYVYNVNYVPHYILALVQTVCLAVKICCCVSTLKVLRRPGPGTRERDDGEVSAVKRRAFATVCMNLLSFLIQTFPLTTAMFMYTLLSISALVLALNISFYVYIIVGLVQTVFFLYQFGTLASLCQP